MAYDKIVDSAKLDTGMTATANAIRAKTGGTDSISWDENTGFADAVGDIPIASSPVLQSKSVTPTKSKQEVTADSGYDGLKKVTVNAIPSNYITPSGTKSITKNGTHDVKTYASVNVNVPERKPVLTTLTATSNETYTPPSGYDGYSSVTVSVPTSGGIGNGGVRAFVTIEAPEGKTFTIYHTDFNGRPFAVNGTDNVTIGNTADAMAISAPGCSGCSVEGGIKVLLDVSDFGMYIFGFTSEIDDAKITFYK